MNAGLRGAISPYVPQGNTLLSGTIADNLRMVKPDASDDRQLRAALEAACAWDFVSAMDGGLNASVGEHGHGLSGGAGPAHRHCPGPAADAPVLLLDEATSALDVTTERTILRNLAARYPPQDLHRHHPPAHGDLPCAAGCIRCPAAGWSCWTMTGPSAWP